MREFLFGSDENKLGSTRFFCVFLVTVLNDVIIL